LYLSLLISLGFWGIMKVLGWISILIGMAYITLWERKILGAIHRRRGLNIVIAQPLVDGVKLIIKEYIVPSKTNNNIYLITAMMSLGIGLIIWGFIPITNTGWMFDTNISILFWISIGSIGVYSIIGGGWSSNSKYSIIGSIRSIGQMISYEVTIGIIVITIVYINNTMNIIDISNKQFFMWNIFGLWLGMLIMFISGLAETSRSLFDLLEGESEIVSGYNVEYTGITFGFYFMGETLQLMIMSSIIVICYLGGWYVFGFKSEIFMGIKLVFVIFIIMLIRAAVLRFRFDQLMKLIWEGFLPLSMGYIIWIFCIFTSMFRL